MFLAKNKELQEAFREGTRESMDEIYRHYCPGVHRFLRNGFTFRSGGGHCYFKGIKTTDDLNVAVQEVFRRAFEDRARNAYNGINSFSNWVLAIARNMVINQFRNREIAFSDYISPNDDGRGHMSVVDSPTNETYAGVLYGTKGKSQDESVEYNQLKTLIAEFMAGLTEEDRKILVYRFIENQSQEEAATALDSTRMKIRTAEAKLRRRLRAFLSGTGYTDHFEED